jgi:hypothetical protein
VKSYQEPENILWWDKKGKASWLWQLDQVEQGKTRLLTRLRTTERLIIRESFFECAKTIACQKIKAKQQTGKKSVAYIR